MEQMNRNKQDISRSYALIRNYIKIFDVIFSNKRRKAGDEDIDTDEGKLSLGSTGPEEIPLTMWKITEVKGPTITKPSNSEHKGRKGKKPTTI